MIIFVVLIFALSLYQAKGAKFHADYMAREKTTAINGLFTLLVFLSHVSTYIALDGALDKPYVVFKEFLGQAVVASFLFYSGYGVGQCIGKKGLSYVRTIPWRRFFKVFYRMAIAVCLYILMNLALGIRYGVKKNLLAFTGWTDIGNSNWYIFAVLCIYLIVFVSFILVRGNRYAGTALTAFLTVLFVYVQIKLDRPSWTYDTVMLFPAGMVFSLIKPFTDKLFSKSDGFYFCAFAACAGVFAVFSVLKGRGLVFFTPWVFAFTGLLVLLTMKLSIKNTALSFFGSHLCSIYMLQRIPMIVFSRFGLNEYPYLFVLVCFAVTLALALAFDRLTEKCDRLLYPAPKRAAE